MATNGKTAPRINFGPVPKDVRIWTIHQRRYVRSLILAAIYRPGIATKRDATKNEEREPVRRALSVHVASKMAKASPKLTPEDEVLYRRLCRLILERLESIIEAPNAREIMREFTLFPNLKKQQKFMKELYAAGAVVQAMYRLQLANNQELAPSAQKARLIVGNWTPNFRWRHNDAGDGWKRFKPVAHLVAAWTIAFPPVRDGNFSKRGLTELRDQLPQFLANAEFLRDFLVTPPELKRQALLSDEVCRPLPSLKGLPSAKIPWEAYSLEEQTAIFKFLSTKHKPQRKKPTAPVKTLGQ
jgi:hypothetical protein